MTTDYVNIRISKSSHELLVEIKKLLKKKRVSGT